MTFRQLYVAYYEVLCGFSTTSKFWLTLQMHLHINQPLVWPLFNSLYTTNQVCCSVKSELQHTATGMMANASNNRKHYTDPVATSHSLIVLSREELTMKSPFGINETLDTLWSW